MTRYMIGFALTLGAALAIQIAGCKGNASAEPTANVTQAPASGKVAVTVGQDGFSPSNVTARKGQPLTLEFKRITDKTCATQVAFPELNLTKDLPLNTAVAIQIPTEQTRTLTFQCGMGMYKSSVVIQ
jgi:plastocyanin domain-containing protein